MDLSLLETLNADRDARRAAILVTDLETGAQRLVRQGDDLADDPLGEDLKKRFRSAKSGIVEDAAGKAQFLTVSVPPPRLVVIGAVHISQALVPMAEVAGFDVTVIDPRTAFATPERFPERVLKPDWPQDVLKAAPLDGYTALAALTHDPKIDDYPIQAALEAGCFYVGALGSRKTHGKRLDRLKEAGVADTVLSRIQAPIGLDIGAASPAEIAVAVLGAVIAALRKEAETR
ncbi:XdhC family protein [Stappia sp. F7233]|uniref:XdhC family protein n=1 Tax=Stappia albiluteola TaxID=2758565 RepID=A0A839ACY3_9HYPH|nr:XdhC family protein [Stappia albiluteola]MBA5776975.1 XdhC family protein [Stappia albiluteola]